MNQRRLASAAASFGLLVLTACSAEDPPPTSRVAAAQLDAAQAINLQRSGVVRLTWVVPDEQEPVGAVIPVHLQAPGSRVEDADIRGLMDGRGRYAFNQGRSYHMRVGRRYHGSNPAAYELKRSLIRFDLDRLPPEGKVEQATLSLWIERFLADSPLANDTAGFLPLHANLYAIAEPWNEGAGGIERDDFSPAAEGEVDWLSARAGKMAWSTPGALRLAPTGSLGPYEVAPLAVALIEGDDRWLDFTGPLLTLHIDSLNSIEEDASFLIKLQNSEEDRWGTELAFLTSEFGVDWDHSARRPRLSTRLSIPGHSTVMEVPYVLEPGENIVLPMSPYEEGALLLAEVTTAGGLAPEVIVASGKRDRSTAVPVRGPMMVDPTDSLWLSGAPHEVTWGDTVRLELEASWVKPGPRAVQKPEFVFIAPSQRIHRLHADSADHRTFLVEFRPDEPGLWRYAWTFRPAPEWRPGTHQGVGLFYVSVPTGGRGASALREFASLVMSDSAEGREALLSRISRANSFVRWNRRFRLENESASELADSLLAEFRSRWPQGIIR